MKIKKVSNNTGTWYSLKNPVEVETPNGSQTVSRFYFNGFYQHYDVTFNHEETGEFLTIQCTDNHPFRLRDSEEFIRVMDLNTGEPLDGGWFVFDIKEGDGVVPTMDMEVPVEHCYVLEKGIVSHNTALLMGGASESISPHIAMTYTQVTPAGEIERVNPELVDLMKRKNIFSKKHVKEVIEKKGSVQEVSWLTDEEKLVFRTAFEINQEVLIRYASQRQRYIDQGQSVNLFFAGNADEEEIARIHQIAFLDPHIGSLYYIYSRKDAVVAKQSECLACM